MLKRISALVGAFAFATNAVGAVIINETKITGTLTHGVAYGGCMIEIPEGPGRDKLQTAGCNRQYISVGCTANPAIGISRANAAANFSAAQLAMVSNAPVDLVVNENLTYNREYCVAVQIVVRPQL